MQPRPFCGCPGTDLQRSVSAEPISNPLLEPLYIVEFLEIIEERFDLAEIVVGDAAVFRDVE